MDLYAEELLLALEHPNGTMYSFSDLQTKLNSSANFFFELEEQLCKEIQLLFVINFA